jgi:outer membrane protein assembly factor BamB
MEQSILQMGADALATATTGSCGLPVVYRQGDVTISDLDAVVGRTPFRTESSDGASIVSIHRDFLVWAADMVDANGNLFEPKRGDKIDQDDGDGHLYTYEVNAPAGEPAWRYSDSGNKRMRIHAVRTKTTQS